MFEKIVHHAEKLATKGVQSRRGFLGLTSKAALSLASLVGGLLLFPREAPAFTGSCVYCCPDGTTVSHNCPCEPSIKHKGITCGLCEKSCGY
jgi:hypothetical protein